MLQRRRRAISTGKELKQASVHQRSTSHSRVHREKNAGGPTSFEDQLAHGSHERRHQSYACVDPEPSYRHPSEGSAGRLGPSQSRAIRAAPGTIVPPLWTWPHVFGNDLLGINVGKNSFCSVVHGSLLCVHKPPPSCKTFHATDRMELAARSLASSLQKQ